ncbi:MAG: TonB-dependent receptor [Verrucomicrobia bacterium]|nr:TonB-dependent receptor [Verrucomicrobiota bacterium]
MKRTPALVASLLVLAFASASDFARAGEPTGAVTGTVSNLATGNLLEGAQLELPALGLRTLTDATGRYLLVGVPAGSHEIVASYVGLDAQRRVVTIAASGRAAIDFDLTTGIYRLDTFKVIGEREGDAAAITQQRNADNVKNIIAMDSFGNLPNLSAGEVVMRLPGIAGNLTDEGLAYEFNVRGMAPGLNSVTVDGSLLPAIGSSRSFQLQSITGAMFETLELIKGHTPDKSAGSLGGTVNMKTRSPLSMREKRRLTYSGTVRVAPSFLEQVPLREQHRSHPLLTLGYQEVFDVFGGSRNLGLAANLFYSENGVGGHGTVREFQNNPADPAYVWSYRVWDNYNNRKQKSLNLKADYRFSFNSKFTVSVTLNDNIEKWRRLYEWRAYTGSATTVPNATTSGVIPGFTDRITQVRPVSGSVIDVKTSGPNNYLVRTYQMYAGGEHEWGPLQVEYSAGLAENNLWQGTGVGYLTNRISAIGWILDRTESDLFPKFIQTAGPDVTNPANYRPIANGFTRTPQNNIQQVRDARLDARYTPRTGLPLSLKAGLSWREQEANLQNFSRRWSYLGASALPHDPSIPMYNAHKTGLNIPMWEVAPLVKNGEPADPSLWREDRYYAEQTLFTGRRGVTEAASAIYGMAQGRLGREGWRGRTGYLAGVRWERTDTESYGWVRARFGSTTAQQTADPVGSAQRDYANTRRDTKGSYTKAFPSIHLTHDVTSHLKTRLSWSTSFGRPGMTNLMPNESVNETNQTVTVNNPSLLPQMATNWDATLEYYFEPVGRLSAGWFHKTIKDYIVSGIVGGVVPGGNDNGYNGEYEGFTRLSSANAGTAVVQGWEFSYQQQFTFLPGLLRGLSGSANYTVIDTHGDFGGTAYRRTGEVAGFIPKAANLGLSWRHRAFSARVLYNFTGEHITSYSSTSPALNLYRYTRKTTSVGLVYQLRPAVSLTLDIANLFNEPQRVYVGNPDRMQTTINNFITVTGGISGRF